LPMLTLAGVASVALLSERVMVTPPAVGLSRLTVQDALCPLAKLTGEQVNVERAAGAAGATRLSEADWVPPFKEAVMVAVSLEVTLTTDAVNCALPWPARIVTEDGMLTLALPSERDTDVFAGAAKTSETVQVAVPADVKLFGVQVKPDNPAGATNPTWVVRTTPLRFAVIVAVWLDAMAPALTEKVPLLAPFAMVREPGVVNWALLSERVMVEPPIDALSRIAVQVAL